MKNLNNLALLSKAGNEEALNELIISLYGENKKIGRYVHLLYPHCGITLEEICSVGITSIYKAALKYDTSVGDFVPFWKKIYKVDSAEYIKANSYSFHASSYRGAFSLDEPLSDGGAQYSEIIGKVDDSISECLINEDLKKMLNDPKIGLGKRERDVLNLRCQGYKREEIAIILNIKPPSVSRILRSIKAKCEALRKAYLKDK